MFTTSGIERLPNYLILDSSEIINDMRSVVGDLETFNMDEESVLDIIFTALHNKDEAKAELGYECFNISRDSIGYEYHEDVEKITDSMLKFGERMQEYLIKLGIYKNNILPFQYSRMIGTDIVLKLI